MVYGCIQSRIVFGYPLTNFELEGSISSSIIQIRERKDEEEEFTKGITKPRLVVFARNYPQLR